MGALVIHPAARVPEAVATEAGMAASPLRQVLQLVPVVVVGAIAVEPWVVETEGTDRPIPSQT